MSLGLPIVLDVTDWPVLIAGGGSVGARRAGILSDAGARVTVISPVFVENFPNVKCVEGVYQKEMLDGNRMAIAATNDSIVNDEIILDARARSILTSRADESDVSADYVLPALGQRGVAAFAVSAGSAALSVAIRDRLLERWDDRWTAMADLMQTLRPMVRGEMKLSPEARTGLFRLLATEEALNILANEGRDGVMQWIEKKLTPYPGPLSRE